MINQSGIFLLWGVALLFLLWRTHSLRVDIPTTLIICGVTLTGTLHLFGHRDLGLSVLFLVLSALTWRVIPHETKDTWVKKS